MSQKIFFAVWTSNVLKQIFRIPYPSGFIRVNFYQQYDLTCADYRQ